jgi:Glycosyltransferase family 87
VRILKWILVACALLLVIGFARTRPLQDFVEYWAAAQQFLAGRNPYSFPEVWQLERSLGWSKSFPALPPNPPWALPLIAPLGLVNSYSAAWIIWVGILTFLVWWSAKLLLGIYSNGQRLFPSETGASEGILGFTFYPTLMCLGSAQITPFVLLGVAGFLRCSARRRYARAGACLALAAIKPHLVYLLWPALLFWCWRKKTWKPLLSFAAAIGSLLGIAVLMGPRLLSEYWEFSRSGYVRIWPSGIGAILRYPFDSVKSFPLQFVAPVFGLAWFLFYWRRRAEDWDWIEQMPMLIAVSVLTTPYGWTLDQVLLLVPIVAIIARYVSTQGVIPQRIVWAYTAVNVAVLFTSFRGPAAAFLIAPLVVTVVLSRLAPSENGARAATAKLSVTS